DRKVAVELVHAVVGHRVQHPLRQGLQGSVAGLPALLEQRIQGRVVERRQVADRMAACGQAVQAGEALDHRRVVQTAPALAVRDHGGVPALPRAQGLGRQPGERGSDLDRIHAAEARARDVHGLYMAWLDMRVTAPPQDWTRSPIPRSRPCPATPVPTARSCCVCWPPPSSWAWPAPWPSPARPPRQPAPTPAPRPISSIPPWRPASSTPWPRRSRPPAWSTRSRVP